MSFIAVALRKARTAFRLISARAAGLASRLVRFRAGRRGVLFIHVGTHKTATTTLQATIRVNQTLLRWWGFEIPEAGADWSSALRVRDFHHDLAWELGGNPARRGGRGSFDDLIAESAASRAPHLLMSSEEFSHLPREKLDRFSEIGRRKTAILYLRRHDAFLAACYAEQIAQGRKTGEFADWLASPKVGFHADYEGVLDAWESAADDLIVRPFDVRYLSRGDVTADFFGHLGVPSRFLQRLERRNLRAQAVKDAAYEKRVDLRSYAEVYERLGARLGLGRPLFDIDEPLERFDPGYGATLDMSSGRDAAP